LQIIVLWFGIIVWIKMGNKIMSFMGLTTADNLLTKGIKVDYELFT
jgi:hypothetical protein